MILLWCADIFNVAVEVWLAYWLFDVPKHRRFHQPWVRVLEYLGFLGIVGWNILQNRILNMRFSNVLILFVIFYFFISAVIFTKRDIFSCLAWGGIYYGTISLLELPGIILSGWLTGQPYLDCIYQPIVYDYIYLVALSVCLIILFSLFGTFIRDHIQAAIAGRNALLWIVFAIIEWWVITYFLYIGFLETGKDVFVYNVVSILCIIVLIFSFAGFIIFRQSVHMRQQSELQEIHMENEYIKIKSEYQRKLREIHDFKHQLQALGAYLADDQIDKAKNYLNTMVGDLIISQQRIHAWTGNPLVDSLLDNKSRKAASHGITLDIYSSQIVSKLSDKDISVLLGNLMDNAIEAAAEALQQKQISVQIFNKSDMLFIRIKNSIGKTPLVKDGKLITTKNDKVNHGWGMKSIEAIVEKYGGQMDISYEKDNFEISITFWEQSEVIKAGERD